MEHQVKRKHTGGQSIVSPLPSSVAPPHKNIDLPLGTKRQKTGYAKTTNNELPSLVCESDVINKNGVILIPETVLKAATSTRPSTNAKKNKLKSLLAKTKLKESQILKLSLPLPNTASPSQELHDQFLQPDRSTEQPQHSQKKDLKTADGSLNLAEKMQSKLFSSQFRWINEKLYTTTSEDAALLFSEKPGLYSIVSNKIIYP